jgi:hypothetical protein
MAPVGDSISPPVFLNLKFKRKRGQENGICCRADVDFLSCKEKEEDVQGMSLPVKGQLPANKT